MLSPFVEVDLPFSEVSTDLQLIEKFRKNCFVGLTLNVIVADSDRSKSSKKSSHLHGSRATVEEIIANPNHRSATLDAFSECSPTELQEGNLALGVLDLRNRKVFGQPAFSVICRGPYIGRICVTELADKEDWADFSQIFSGEGHEVDEVLVGGHLLKHGQVINSRILSISNNLVNFSLRPSRLVSLSEDELSSE
jgi:hypothetical protein